MMMVNLGYEVWILCDYGLNVDKVYSKAGNCRFFPWINRLESSFPINLNRLVQMIEILFYVDLHFQM